MASIDDLDRQIAEAQERVKRLKKRRVEIEQKKHLEELEALEEWARSCSVSNLVGYLKSIADHDNSVDTNVTVFAIYESMQK